MHRVQGRCIDGEQRNEMRDQRRGDRLVRVERASDALWITGLQGENLENVGIRAPQIRLPRSHSTHRRAPSSSRRVVASVNVSDSRGMLVTNGPTTQPNP